MENIENDVTKEASNQNSPVMNFDVPKVIRVVFSGSKIPQVFEDIIRATVTAQMVILTDEFGSSFIRKGEWVEFDILADYVPDNFYGSENEFVEVMNAYDIEPEKGKAN